MKLAVDLKGELDRSKWSGFFPSDGSGATGFNSFITNLISTVITVAGILLLAYFLYGAVVWTTAAGDQKKLDEAKQIMMNAITGMVLVVISYFVVGLVGGILGIDNILSPIFPFLKPQ